MGHVLMTSRNIVFVSTSFLHFTSLSSIQSISMLIWVFFTKALFTRDIFCTQYCNKNIFWTNFFHRVNWKYLLLNNFMVVWKDFKMQLQYFGKKCLFIFLLQYLFIEILCAKKSCDVGLSWNFHRNSIFS